MYPPMLTSEDSPYEPVSFYLVTEDVWHVFTKRYSTSELHDYAKLREMLPVADIIALDILAKHLLAKRSKTSNEFYPRNRRLVDSLYGVEGRHPPMTTEQVAQAMTTLQLTEKNPTAIAAILAPYYEDDQGDECVPVCSDDVVERPYKVFVHQASVYIVVGDGCFEFLEDSRNCFEFVSDVLREAYAIYPLLAVNETEWYSIYMDHVFQKA